MAEGNGNVSRARTAGKPRRPGRTAILILLSTVALTACDLRTSPFLDDLLPAAAPAVPGPLEGTEKVADRTRGVRHIPPPAPAPAPPQPAPQAPPVPAEPEGGQAAPAPPPPPAPAAPKPTAPSTPAPGADRGVQAMERQMLDLVNAERAKVGLPALELDEGLTRAARSWSREMASSGDFRHDDIKVPPGFTTAGENIAYGTNRDGIVTVLHEGLMDSRGHRANILRERFTSIGIGFAVKDGKTYVTQRFAG